MKYSKTPPLCSTEGLFLHCLGIGLFPWAPGTLASLATLPLLYGLGQTGLPVFFLIPVLILLIIGSGLVVHMVQKRHDLKDPSWIVIDEVIGMLVGFLFWPSSQWWSLFLLFILFRLFDIFKPWPASFCDQRIEHGIGVILDDVVAGGYAGVSMFFIHSIINF